MRQAAVFILLVVLIGCKAGKTAVGPSITFTRVPETTLGDPDKLDIIQGRVEGARQGQQIVLYAKRGEWWLQPLSNEPFTTIQNNSSWINSTRLGSEYAALLVEPGYRPQATLNALPEAGNGVAAVAISKDFPAAFQKSTTLQFSGYEWRVRNATSTRGDRVNPYSTANAWVDKDGALHLKIAKESDKWTCAEVTLTRSFGYGQYSFVVRDTSKLAPSVALSMFTWDYAGGDQNHREMAIEIRHRGDPANKNAQYVVQPFYVAANVARLNVPTGVVRHSFRWEPGKLTFRTVSESETISEHVFTSGVPSPGVETVRMALYILGNTDNSEQNGTEVVIDKFEYLP
jgi:hypothetical protein